MREYVQFIKGEPLTPYTDKIILPLYLGYWYVIDTTIHEGMMLFLLENEQNGDEDPGIIVDEQCNVILDEAWDGFGDLSEEDV